METILVSCTSKIRVDEIFQVLFQSYKKYGYRRSVLHKFVALYAD